MTTTQATDPWVPEDTLGSRLVRLRLHLDLSQRSAAEQSGVPYGVWQGMENGRGTRSVQQHIMRIAEAFHVDRDWLMWGQIPTQGDREAGGINSRWFSSWDGVSERRSGLLALTG